MKCNTLLPKYPQCETYLKPVLCFHAQALCSRCIISTGPSLRPHTHSIHGPGQGWAGGGGVGEVAKDPDKRGADFKFVNLTGWARVLDSRGGVCSCFTFIMAVVQTEGSLCSQPWQRPLYIYGGLACNSLMAGELCFFCLIDTFSSFFIVLMRENNFFVVQTFQQVFARSNKSTDAYEDCLLL